MESATLHIRLFGTFDMRLGDRPLPKLDSARAESLLAFLLLHGDAPQTRQRLAFLLWPESSESQARTNLRHLLHTLRHTFPGADTILDITPRTVQWRPRQPVWFDVARFAEAIARAERAGGELDALREAVELYTGDLLEECYDEWLLDERERLHEQFLSALERVIELLHARGDYAGAIHYANRFLRHDPLREETYRLLMRLHDASGNRARALHVYHECASTLERELGVEPAASTREAYEGLLSTEKVVRLESRLGGPPLIGRGPEKERLASAWRATEHGQTQFVLVTGEPGIGKTRLVDEFRSWCVHRGAVAAEARSYSAEGTLAYGVVVAWLRAEDIASRVRRLELAQQTELSRLLPELLTDVTGLSPPEPLSEGEQRQRLFSAIAHVICSPEQPLLLVADDLQWCDRESLQFIHYLLRTSADARLLVAATARREEIDHWRPLNELLVGLHALDRCVEIELDRLAKPETAVLAARITGRTLRPLDIDRLYDETEGSPLFIIEALRAGWHEGEVGQISPRVQSVIRSRLDQLSETSRDLVRIAATIGRAFTTDVLADAAETDTDILVQGLDELWRRRIIREQGADAYDFSHDKIREVAYLSAGPARRRQAHLQVARALERRSVHDPGFISSELASHYERAGMPAEAIIWYERAAEATQELHANLETIRLLERALDLLRVLPPTSERDRRELAILTELQVPLGWAEGWASERLAALQQRALELHRTTASDPSPPLLRSLAIAKLSRRDFAAARAFGAQLQELGEHDADDILLVESNYVLGIVAFWRGEFEAARVHFESAAERQSSVHLRDHLRLFGLDPKTICLSRLGNTHWFLGDPAAAIRARDAAISLAEDRGHLYSLETCITFAALLAVDMHDHEAVRDYTQMLTVKREEHRTKPVQVAAEALSGYVDVLDGRSEAGIIRIHRTLEQIREADAAPGQRAISLRLLLEAYELGMDARAGLVAADEALASADAARLLESDFRRRRAEFLTKLGGSSDDIEAELARAITIAQGQRAKMVELRAVTSLLRHQLALGEETKLCETRTQLTALLAELPEALESREFQEASSLLS